eukprot:6058573-Amphidinium_carterae.1
MRGIEDVNLQPLVTSHADLPERLRSAVLLMEFSRRRTEADDGTAARKKTSFAFCLLKCFVALYAHRVGFEMTKYRAQCAMKESSGDVDIMSAVQALPLHQRQALFSARSAPHRTEVTPSVER